MKSIEHLTLANLQWLRDVAIPASKLRITQENLDKVMRGKALILQQEMEHLGCYSCSARSYFSVSKSVLEQYTQVILDRITELEAVEFSQPLDVVNKDGEQYFIVGNTTQEYNENDEVSDDVITEKIVSSEYDPESQTLSQTTVKRGRKKNEE